MAGQSAFAGLLASLMGAAMGVIVVLVLGGVAG
ncbi:hypothetical protein L284_19180 [Novosphingobium lindaniclasticum LE124]|jgi:hypothetical protein|uniref:Uncharacterized protein n=1 Tax=Novosphingobium lindaniclasticum LE124 TaxID=1096930 RepID=T0IJ89_9SPHN|nr:hypothetical protein L284_19180 [Novosphingobium lindaniclasticum LE124]